MEENPLITTVATTYFFEYLEYKTLHVYNIVTKHSNKANHRQTQEDIVTGIIPQIIEFAAKAAFSS